MWIFSAANKDRHSNIGMCIDRLTGRLASFRNTDASAARTGRIAVGCFSIIAHTFVLGRRYAGCGA